MQNNRAPQCCVLAALFLIASSFSDGPDRMGFKSFEKHLTTNNMKEDSITMVLTRTLNAPIEKVWKAWSDASFVKHWWGPRGFTAPVVKMNFKEGEASLVCMKSPDGFEIYNLWMYSRIVPLERIEFTLYFSDKDGSKINPKAIGMPPGVPESVPHVITFRAVSREKTELTIAEHGYPNAEAAELSTSGMIECLDKMEEYLVSVKP